MLTIYTAGQKRIAAPDLTAAALPTGAVWLDLLDPTKEEEAFVERVVGVPVPTRDEMVEIEPSSRQYRSGEAVVVIASLVAGAHHAASGEGPVLTPVSFVLTPAHLVTIRYAKPTVFALFGAHVERAAELCTDTTTTLTHLLEAIVDRMADVLEHTGEEIDRISGSTFRRGASRRQRMTNAALEVLLVRIGRAQDVVSKSRMSGVSLARLLSFLGSTVDAERQEQLATLAKDVASLTDHATYLAGNITFLLDAALGLINIEQNAIIKIFSVAAVIFMPPTLVASIYGMNFKAMPELNFHYGYPMALGVMICSAVLPYQFFKSRGWL